MMYYFIKPHPLTPTRTQPKIKMATRDKHRDKHNSKHSDSYLQQRLKSGYTPSFCVPKLAIKERKCRY